MAEIIPNQPIHFGTSNSCGCESNEYQQLMQHNDEVSFQIGNPCAYYPNGEVIGDTDLGNWDTNDDYGGTDTWSYVDPNACASGGSTIIRTDLISVEPPVMVIGGQYRLKFTTTLQPGCTIQICLFYADTDAVTGFSYDVIYTISESGSYTKVFIASRVYSKIGFRIVGTCEVSSCVSDVSLFDFHADECLEFCIKDSDDNVIIEWADLQNHMSIEYHMDYIQARFPWQSLIDEHNLADGCYKICICNDDEMTFGDNILPDWYNGTFENGDEGWDASLNPGIYNSTVYRGLYSYSCGNDNAAVDGWLAWRTSGVMLNRSMQYRAECRIFVVGNTIDAGEIHIECYANTHTIQNVSVISNTHTCATGQWLWLACTIDNTVGVNRPFQFGVRYTGFDTGVDYQFYIDEVMVYPVDSISYCSEVMSLQTTYECSLSLQWYGNHNELGFFYDTGTFYQYLRVTGKLRNAHWGEGENITFKDSEGNRMEVYADRSKIKELILDEMPEYLHNALSLGLVHDNFSIDGIDYVCIDNDYNPQWRKSSELAPVRIMLLEKTGNFKNMSC